MLLIVVTIFIALAAMCNQLTESVWNYLSFIFFKKTLLTINIKSTFNWDDFKKAVVTVLPLLCSEILLLTPNEIQY
jgi:hypothetical protein